jgi:hypothetical protein
MVSLPFLRLQIAYRYFHWEDGSQYVLRLISKVTYTAMISPARLRFSNETHWSGTWSH